MKRSNPGIKGNVGSDAQPTPAAWSLLGVRPLGAQTIDTSRFQRSANVRTTNETVTERNRNAAITLGK